MHSVWAVAMNTIKQALRMKIAAVFVILLIVLLPVMGFAMTGDGTVKGAVIPGGADTAFLRVIVELR